jgi:hypothetical protein
MKRVFFFTLVVAVAAILGCSGNDGTPSSPGNDTIGNSVSVAPYQCGEEEFLLDLSPVLASWKDSIEAWRGEEFLDTPPTFVEDDDVIAHLLELSPVLEQWADSINAWLEDDVVDAPPTFESETESVVLYLTALSPVLAQWKSSLEDNRGEAFLIDPPVFEPDKTAPVITCSEDTTVACAGEKGAVVTFETSALDECDPSPTITCDPASGSEFPLGETVVTCTAVDESGNSSECSFAVMVTPAEPPVISCPDDTTAECGGDGTIVEFEVTAMSSCDAPVTITCEPPSGSTFPLGETPVSCVAVDTFNLKSECTFVVTVEDNVPPVLNGITASKTVLWPPNHKMVTISVFPDVTDACDAAPECHIIDVVSNEPVNDLGDGNTEPDWVIVDDLEVQLRAERAGVGSNRVYTIHVMCEDGAGNKVEGTVEVMVPHDQGGSMSTGSR